MVNSHKTHIIWLILFSIVTGIIGIFIPLVGDALFIAVLLISGSVIATISFLCLTQTTKVLLMLEHLSKTKKETPISETVKGNVNTWHSAFSTPAILSAWSIIIILVTLPFFLLSLSTEGILSIVLSGVFFGLYNGIMFVQIYSIYNLMKIPKFILNHTQKETKRVKDIHANYRTKQTMDEPITTEPQLKE